MSMTQLKFVEHILIKDGEITRNKCLVNYVSRLSAIISKLKDAGYEFETDYIEVKTPFGYGKDYRYKVTKYPTKEIEDEN